MYLHFVIDEDSRKLPAEVPRTVLESITCTGTSHSSFSSSLFIPLSFPEHIRVTDEEVKLMYESRPLDD